MGLEGDDGSESVWSGICIHVRSTLCYPPRVFPSHARRYDVADEFVVVPYAFHTHDANALSYRDIQYHQKSAEQNSIRTNLVASSEGLQNVIFVDWRCLTLAHQGLLLQ